MVATHKDPAAMSGHNPFVSRIAHRLAVALLPATLVLAGVAPSVAQGTPKATYGDWQIRCETPPGAQSEQCALVQNVTAEDRPNVGLSVIALRTADGKSKLLRVLAPLGVLLPAGLGLRVDGNDVGRRGFTRCLQIGCFAEAELDDELLGKLGAGKAATFIIFQTPEEGIGVPVSLNGFKQGFDALNK